MALATSWVEHIETNDSSESNQKKWFIGIAAVAISALLIGLALVFAKTYMAKKQLE